MRPNILLPLFASVQTLKGVGENVGKALNRLLLKPSILNADEGAASATIRDLVFHLPSGMIDRRIVSPVAETSKEQLVTCIVTVQSHHPPPRAKGRRIPYKVICNDETGDLLLTFFNSKGDYLGRTLPVGEKRVVSGRIELYDGIKQIPHPDIMAPVEKLNEVARLDPVYPLTYAISQKQLQKLIAQAVSRLPKLPEWIDAAMLKQHQWLPWDESLKHLHGPQDDADLRSAYRYHNRLAYDEILANQLALAILRKRNGKQVGIQIPDQSTLLAQLKESLPFKLTGGQQQVLQEIADDMQSGHRMLRLLQGDVGSGKTIVALLSMMPLIEQSYQAALMVPTEILGKQHVATISKLIEPLGLKAAMLSGKMPAKERKVVMEQLEQGEIHILIGTHALFQEKVNFHKLGYVVIDEQHRFGVNQRLALSSKGENPHVLLMTATPIPRSLTMTAYGDMDSSILSEKPANRPKIETRAIPLQRIEEVVDGLKRTLTADGKVYWICPLVEEGEDVSKKDFEGDLAAAEERYRVFQKVFGDQVALAHGKMKPADRHAAMEGFAGDQFNLIVATTVVEVGVDVPEATVIVIEHAERFGLAQLHQLRGRVGRGDKPSSCVLLYSSKCSEYAKKRLSIIRETDDGFKIAEEDLILRGAGDVLGTRQSGSPDFRFIDLAEHRELVYAARDDVKLILHQDPELKNERAQALKTLLYLFEYEKSLRFLEAG